MADEFPGIPDATRPIVEAALETVRDLAPKTVTEVAYNSKRPSSASAMWKLVRFRAGGGNVLGIGTFSRHSTIFFYRGTELEAGNGLLQGSGAQTRFLTLRTPADARSAPVKSLVRKAFRLGG